MTNSERLKALWQSEEFRKNLHEAQKNRRPRGSVKREGEERLRRIAEKKKLREVKSSARLRRQEKKALAREGLSPIKRTYCSECYHEIIRGACFCEKKSENKKEIHPIKIIEKEKQLSLTFF